MFGLTLALRQSHRTWVFCSRNFSGGHLAISFLCRPNFKEIEGEICYLGPEEILKMKCHIFVDCGGGLCLLRNTFFNEQSIKWKEFKAQVS